MKVLPWVCVLVLVIGMGWLYSSGQKREAEMATLREESQQLQQARAELEQIKSGGAQAASDEVVRLRKQLEDLPRLRNEAQKLRTEKQQLSTQLQTAQAQALGAQEQVQSLRATAAQAPVPGQPNPAVPGVVPAGAREPMPTPAQQQLNLCINNLRIIDGAKQQWALEKQKAPGALMTAADLAPYFKGNALPACPAGGIYTLNPVNLAPICSIPGHAIPK
jgi:hypothetical protein